MRLRIFLLVMTLTWAITFPTPILAFETDLSQSASGDFHGGMELTESGETETQADAWEDAPEDVEQENTAMVPDELEAADTISDSDETQLQTAEVVPSEDDSEEPSGRIIVSEEAYLYTADMYYEKAQMLVERYPTLLRIEVLGQSLDGRPLFVVVLAKDIKTASKESLFIRRYQLLVESGTHARETLNPYLTIRTLEDYCMDVEDNSFLPEINVAGIIAKGTFHFLILSNPDGYDVVKHGVDSIRDAKLKSQFLSILGSKDPTTLKAGIDGVDRNRNYRDEYFNVTTKAWVNQFYTKAGDTPQKPALEGYMGPYPASAVETQIIQKYIERYSFRAVLSYHSSGRVIFYIKEYFSLTFNNLILKPLATVAGNVTGYWVDTRYDPTAMGSGYLSHFVVNLTQKPSLTVETTNVRSPAPLSIYESEYQRVRLLPFRVMERTISTGFYDYKVFVENKYFQDYKSYSYAQAVAKKYRGRVFTKPGLPVEEFIPINVDGTRVQFPVDLGSPYINQDDRTMIPLRIIATSIGATVDWKEGKQQAEIIYGDIFVEVPLGTTWYRVNGKRVYMDTKSVIEDGRIYIPLRFVFDAMGYKVDYVWTGEYHLINMNKR